MIFRYMFRLLRIIKHSKSDVSFRKKNYFSLYLCKLVLSMHRPRIWPLLFCHWFQYLLYFSIKFAVNNLALPILIFIMALIPWKSLFSQFDQIFAKLTDKLIFFCFALFVLVFKIFIILTVIVKKVRLIALIKLFLQIYFDSLSKLDLRLKFYLKLLNRSLNLLFRIMLIL